MKAGLAFALVLSGILIAAQAEARDCTISKNFRLKKTQVLSGILQNPNGHPLPGLELELLSRQTVLQRVRADNEGRFSFGELPPGKYRVHVLWGGDPFCAPKAHCGNQGCTFEPKLKLNPQNGVVVLD